MTADLAEISTALTAQWDRLRTWTAPLGDDLLGARDRPSALEGWTTGELVAHLGRAMEALTVCVPAPPGTVPLTLAEYLGTYPDRAEHVAAATRELAREIAHAPLTEVDALARAALARLGELGPDGRLVVQGRRAPVTLRDMAASRLVELVVHADDLAASLVGTVDSAREASPVDRTAQRIVADELLRIVTTRVGGPLEVVDARLWIRLATGRERYDVDALARAVSTQETATGVPDLGRVLPVL